MSFEATHRVGAETPTWPSPDRTQPPGPNLYAGLEVRVVEQQGDLTKVLCDNGWEAWTDSTALTPLVVAPTGPPPPAAAAAAAPPPPPTAVTAAPAPEPASTRPAWLVPAAIAAVVVVLVGIFVMQGGDDDATTTNAGSGGGETVKTTARVKAAAFTADSFPSIADLETAAPASPSEWKIRELCTGGATGAMTGDEDCDVELDDFNSLCSDEFLGGTESQDLDVERPIQRAERRASTTLVDEGDPQGSVNIKLRLYKTTSGAEEALEEVEGYYQGSCSASGEDATTVYSKVAIGNDDLGDDYIAYQGVDDFGSVDHVWVRFGTVLAQISVSDEDDFIPTTIFRDVAQSIGARTADLR